VALEYSKPSTSAAKTLVTLRPLTASANTTGITQKAAAKTMVKDPIDKLAQRLENVFIQRLEGHNYLRPLLQPI
jgi:hypothetical protein